MSNNPIERAVLDATAAYRAGMGLPPLRYRCRLCGESYAAGVDHDCPFYEDGEDWPNDHKMDDPRHVPYSNLGRK
jgi:hypothetical protein